MSKSIHPTEKGPGDPVKAGKSGHNLECTDSFRHPSWLACPVEPQSMHDLSHRACTYGTSSSDKTKKNEHASLEIKMNALTLRDSL
mmetsp:Transcript_25928/g.37168  ORF Transcript_25928/g.37168 Transcript_25928/m.37168 type:complete len:86 (-) Transcript_25928:262-519(-)